MTEQSSATSGPTPEPTPEPTPGRRQQKRGRRIAMTPDAIDAFLAAQRTCRVATLGPDGPHATPLWFVWDGTCLWLYSTIRSRRWADLQRDPRVGVVVDAGGDYFELHGVELTGTVEIVGELPRTGEVNDELTPVEAQFARKNLGIDELFHDGRHAWLRMVPSKITSWDFRKLAELAGP